MKSYLTLLLLLMAFCMHVQAQQKPADQVNRPAPAITPVSVDQLLARYVKALGGEEAARRITTLSFKGTLEFPDNGLKGSFEYYQKAPHMMRTVFRMPGNGLTVIRGFDGAIGWELKREGKGTPVINDLRGEELSLMKLNAGIHREYELKRLYPQMTIKGKQRVDETDAFVIEAVPADGRPERMYFDAQTGLLIRRDVLINTPMGLKPFEDYLDDYREVNGVRIPFTVSTLPGDNSKGGFIIRFTEAQANAPLADDLFLVPRK